MRIGSVFLEFERIPHDGSSREVHKVFTEEEDADENGWIAVILRACNIIV